MYESSECIATIERPDLELNTQLHRFPKNQVTHILSHSVHKPYVRSWSRSSVYWLHTWLVLRLRVLQSPVLCAWTREMPSVTSFDCSFRGSFSTSSSTPFLSNDQQEATRSWRESRPNGSNGSGTMWSLLLALSCITRSESKGKGEERDKKNERNWERERKRRQKEKWEKKERKVRQTRTDSRNRSRDESERRKKKTREGMKLHHPMQVHFSWSWI